jgi:hypothetical protein
MKYIFDMAYRHFHKKSDGYIVDHSKEFLVELSEFLNSDFEKIDVYLRKVSGCLLLTAKNEKYSVNVMMHVCGSYGIWYTPTWAKFVDDGDLKLIYNSLDSSYERVGYGFANSKSTEFMKNSGKFYHELDDHEINMLKFLNEVEKS